MERVLEMLLAINMEKPVGLDNIDGKLLRMAAHHIVRAVTHIFNQSIKLGAVPQAWKEAKIFPLPKNAKMSLTGVNSRPISILPQLAKLIEKNVFTQIQSYFKNNKLNSDSQHAYRDGFSTCTALSQLCDNTLQNLDSRKLVGSVMLDFSAAFDVIDHEILAAKLRAYSFDSTAISWLVSYLTGRKQQVFFNGSLSDCKDVVSGVPQGSSLGPLLFTIFTNDLPLVLRKASLVSYADDTTLYMASSTVEKLSDELNKELELVLRWVKNNKMILNTSKTKSILFGTQSMLQSNPKLNLLLDKTEVLQVDEVKLLGVTIDKKLSWSSHITNITKKMGSAIAVIRRCAAYLTNESIIQVIKALVLAHLDYCSPVWSTATKNDLNKLQIAQNRAARLALNCSNMTNVLKMHKNLSWLLVEQRLKANLLCLFRNISFKKEPYTLYKSINYTSERHHYQTRRVTSGGFTKPKPKSEFLKATVMYRAMAAWEDLPREVVNCKGNKTQFKRKVKEYLGKD